MTPALRIAHNDPALAHAMARVANESAIRAVVTGARKAAKLSFGWPGFVTLVGEENIIDAEVIRPKGSRAKWHAIVLLPDAEGFEVCIYRRANGRTVSRVVAHFTRHAVARLMQRTTNSSDIAAIRPVLRYYALEAVHRVYGMTKRGETGDSSLAGALGAFLGVFASGVLTLATWVDAATASDPDIRRACEAARAGANPA